MLTVRRLSRVFLSFSFHSVEVKRGSALDDREKLDRIYCFLFNLFSTKEIVL